MTIQHTNHTHIDHKSIPYKILHELTGLEKDLIRKLDKELCKISNHSTEKLVRIVLEISENEFRTLVNHDKEMTIVMRDA